MNCLVVHSSEVTFLQCVILWTTVTREKRIWECVCTIITLSAVLSNISALLCFSSVSSLKVKKKKMFSSSRPPPGFTPVVFLFLSVLLIAWNISPSVPEAVVYVSPLSTVCLPGRAPPCWAAARPPSWSVCRGSEQVLTWRSALMLFSWWAATQGAELWQNFSSHKTPLHYQIK